MIWQGNSLIDASGTTLAEFFPEADDASVLRTRGVIAVGAARIDAAHTAGALRWKVDGALRGGAETGERFTVRVQGVGVGTLEARCGSRRYTLERETMLGKKRVIIDAEGIVVAETAPKGQADLAVEVRRVVPDVDLAFMVWALTLIDAPARRTMI